MERIAGSPIHTQLYKALKDWFIQEFHPGEQLPTEQAIIKQFNVGRGTARSALNELVRDGLIERSPGRGSFLSPDFLIRLKRYTVAVLLSDREFSGTDTWEYTWHNHVEMLNGAIKESLINNVSLEIIPEGAINQDLNNSYDAFLCFRYINPDQLAQLSKPVVPFHYELDLTDALAGMVRHVAEYGYTSPAYIGSPKAGRIDLLNSFLRMNDLLPLREDAVIECSGTVRDGYLACRQLLNRHISWDCLICSTDLRALGALACLREKGISVPGDRGVCGFDGIREAGQSSPPLTTWAFPWQELGCVAVREVRALLDGMPLPAFSPLEGILTVRGSTASRLQIPPEEDVEAVWEKLYLRSIQSGDPEQRHGKVLEQRAVYDLQRDLQFTYQMEEPRDSAKRVSHSLLDSAVPSKGAAQTQPLRFTSGRTYSVRLAPLPLSPRHFLLLRESPGSRDFEELLTDGLELVAQAPSYTVCLEKNIRPREKPDPHSVVFQILPLNNLPLKEARPLPGHRSWEGKTLAELLDYPLPAVRLSSPDRRALVGEGLRMRGNWRENSRDDHTLNLVFYTKGGLYHICFLHRLFLHPRQKALKRLIPGPVGVLEACGLWRFPADKKAEDELGKNAFALLTKLYKGLSPMDMENPQEINRILPLFRETEAERGEKN